MQEQVSSPLSPDATCIGCGYRLFALSTFTCPECGRASNPSDPTTYRMGSERERWRKWGAPPSRKECWWTAIFGAYVLYCASCPASHGGLGGLGALVCSAVVWVPLLLSYLLRLAILVIALGRPSLDEDRTGGSRSASRLNWMWLPMFFGLSLSSLAYPWPLVLRFQLSHSAFQQAVKDVQSGTLKRSKWVGLYHVSPKTVTPSGQALPRGVVRFEVGNPSLPPDETGFEFAPHSPGSSSNSYQLTKEWRTYSF